MIRVRGRSVLVGALILLTGCGGSVADADRRPDARPTMAAVTPFCAAIQANAEALHPLSTLTARGGAPPEELTNTVDGVRRTTSDLLAVSPDNIRSDVERYVQSIERQLTALLANGGDSAALARDTQLAAELNSPEATASGQRLQAYVQRTCGPAGDPEG